MADLSRFAMSATGLALLGRALGVEVRKHPLNLPSPGPGALERVRAMQRMYDEFESSGLSAGGKLRTGVADAVLLLGRPKTAVSVIADGTRGKWFARVCTDGERVVLVEQVEDRVELTGLPVPGWEQHLTGMLPPMRPAPGGRVLGSRRGMQGQGNEAGFPAEPVPVPHLPGHRGHASTAGFAEVFAAPRSGSGYFLVTGTDRLGRPVYGTPLSWVVTERGAYATSGGGSGPAVPFTPVDNDGLARLLRERVEEVRQGPTPPEGRARPC